MKEEIWIVAGHSHALQKASDLSRETGRVFVATLFDPEEYRRLGAARCHFRVQVSTPDSTESQSKEKTE